MDWLRNGARSFECSESLCVQLRKQALVAYPTCAPNIRGWNVSHHMLSTSVSFQSARNRDDASLLSGERLLE